EVGKHVPATCAHADDPVTLAFQRRSHGAPDLPAHPSHDVCTRPHGCHHRKAASKAAMAVDPKVQALIEAMEGSFPPLDENLSAGDLRALIKQASHVITVAPETVGSVENRTIPGPNGDIAVRVFKPQGYDGHLPVVVFFH